MKNKANSEIKNMFDKISDKYDFMNSVISLGTNEFVKTRAVKSLDIQPNSKVLDLCCGSGELGAIVKKLYPSCDVCGVDFSEKMLDIARKNNKNITYRQADTTSLPFEKNSFNYVLMGFGLRNIPQKNRAIEEIYKILKTNGKFLHLDFTSRQTFASKIYDMYVMAAAKIFIKNTKPYKYLILSKNNFLSSGELVQLFKFNRFKYVSHKNMFFDIISYQIMQKCEL